MIQSLVPLKMNDRDNFIDQCKMVISSTLSLQLEDNIKFSGIGRYEWKNGGCYYGNFENDIREGKGELLWNNGAYYEGDFFQNRRHGHGRQFWPNGESYEGDFFEDFRHGQGCYKWPDGSSYYGTFYLNKRSGFGTHVYSNGNIFKGLYRNGYRYGPGILTYSNSSEDRGLWMNDYLTKLVFNIDNCFSLKNYTFGECDSTEPDKNCNTLSRWHHNISVQESPSSELKCSNPDERSLSLNHELLNKEFFSKCNLNENVSEILKTTEGLSEGSKIQLYIDQFKKYIPQQETPIIKPSCSHKGHLEYNAIKFFESARNGNLNSVIMLQKKQLAYVDVSDNRGMTPLIEAASNLHMAIINFLLDNGANVNHLNSESVSPLSACLIKFYSSVHQGIELTNCKKDYNSEIDPARSNNKTHSKDDLEINLSNEFSPTELKQSHSCPILKSKTKFKFKVADPVIYYDKNSLPFPFVLKSDAREEQFIKKHEALLKNGCTFYNWCDDLKLADPEGNWKEKLKVRHDKFKATVLLLLMRGADPNQRTQLFPALFHAIRAGDSCLVKLLIAHGADVHATIKTKQMELTSVYQACLSNSPAVLQILLEAGANPNIPIKYLDMEENIQNFANPELSASQSPLHLVCSKTEDQQKVLAMASSLLKAGADPNATYQGQSPLVFAIQNGHLPLTKLLLEYGANANLELPSEKQSILGLSLSNSDNKLFSLKRQQEELNLLLDNSVDLLKPFKIGKKERKGSVVDFIHHLYDLDQSNDQNKTSLRVTRSKMAQYLSQKMIEQAKNHIIKSSVLEEMNKFDSKKEQFESSLKFCFKCGRSLTYPFKSSIKYKNIYYCKNLYCKKFQEMGKKEKVCEQIIELKRKQKSRNILPLVEEKKSKHVLDDQKEYFQPYAVLSDKQQIYKEIKHPDHLNVSADTGRGDGFKNNCLASLLGITPKEIQIFDFKRHLRANSKSLQWNPYVENYSYE